MVVGELATRGSGVSGATAGPRVVLLEGDPAAMGVAHGRLLAAEIRLLAAEMERLLFRRVGMVLGMPLRAAALALALLMSRRIPDHIKEEMRGVARGSGLPFATILLINTLDDILNILRQVVPRSPQTACSGFAIWGDHTIDGLLLHGRNLDYHFKGTPIDDGGAVARLLLSQTTVLAFRPEGREPFLSIGWPGVIGVTTGVNRRGISVSNLTSYLRGNFPDGVPTAILYRLVLEQATSLREASEILRAAPRTIGNNLLVGSGVENRASLFEITARRVEEVASEDGLLVSTNHFLSADLARLQRPYLLAHSPVRWRRLRALCSRTGVGVEEALAFLGDRVVEEEWANPLARVANDGTAVSVLMRPADLRLWLGGGKEPPASVGEFRLLDGAELLSSRPSGGRDATCAPRHLPSLPQQGHQPPAREGDSAGH